MKLERFPVTADTIYQRYLLPNRVKGSIPWSDAIPAIRRWHRRYGSADKTFEDAMLTLAQEGGLSHQILDQCCNPGYDQMACKFDPGYNWRKNFVADETVEESSPGLIEPGCLSEYMLFSTVRIETKGLDQKTQKDSKGVATGTLFSYGDTGEDKRILVTNKHIFEDTTSVILNFHLCKAEGDKQIPTGDVYPYTITNWKNVVVPHPQDDIDLCAISIEPIVQSALLEGKTLYTACINQLMMPETTSLNLMPVIQDVFMYGYPIGLWDTLHNLPIVRKGVLASHPALDFCGQPIGAVDIAAFPGSSGSPIFILSDGGPLNDKLGNVWMNRTVCVFLGILSKRARMEDDGTIDITSIPIQHKFIEDKGMLPIHLGYYIKASQIRELADAIPGISA